MNPIVGWGLALAAVVAGWVGWRWQGVALAVTVIAFWLLLQFSRVMRVMRQASQRPVGSVDSAVMLASRVRPGMRLLQILPLARSLGTRLADDPETFAWRDGGGAEIRVELVGGRVSRVELVRPPAEPT